MEKVNGLKFISGANLGLNLKEKSKLFPFYNPPGARGEDTFLSTCIGDSDIRKVPCYTFHDGFGAYPGILQGALPSRLKCNTQRSDAVVKRFLQAAVGWIRYKPLLLYLTDRENYNEQISDIRGNLRQVLPALSVYFHEEKFLGILDELNRYNALVSVHSREFQTLKLAWVKVMAYLKKCEPF